MLTAEQTLAELTAKIVEAVPEIMELKLGCRVEWDGEEMMIVGEGTGNLTRMYQLSGLQSKQVFTCDTEDENGRVEHFDAPAFVDCPWDKVLGRPITLEDVLRAISGTGWGTVDSEGTFWNDTADREMYWQMGKPLSEQSDRTLKWLHSLLHGE